ncbi:D-alanyl-D-alanine carboxypeptidase [Clostridium algifaecis]|uniref:D-alanyl-D-alanine carboxypeptidase n=1 Tax=Clostridium algifaecis TaxID=1472040 RepID=A0ABS4KNU3_9CLOT|nr:D-alanyl-D-alanine carboxypeptidase family protein [Clostridium algifaecis]MBP2031709.1 D-alanyl-D-alanine carboxypeptidase [Clostridium algifaecis]
MNKNKFYIIITFIIVFLLNFDSVYAKDQAPTPSPQIYGMAAITVDMQTGEIIYEKNIDSKIYPASTTKLLTALILAESKSKNSTLTYTKDAKMQPTSSLNRDIHPIDIGDSMSAESAMDAMLMHSANDIAYMIGENLSKDIPHFADKMNKKVKDLNLKNTHFVTPNGLHNKDHYSTAYDMSVIGRQAFKNKWIRETINKSAITIKTKKGISFPIKNTNKLLGKDGCIGGKTGYTDPAGRCLVAVYERSGRKILGVVMKSEYDPNDTYVFNDMEKIINWSYSKKPDILYKKNSIIVNKTLKYKPLIVGPHVNITIPIKVSDNVLYYENAVNKNELKQNIKLNNLNIKNLNGTNPIGTLNIKQRENSKDYKLYSSLASNQLIKKVLPFYIAAFVILFLVILIFILILRKFYFNKYNKNPLS